MKSKPWITRGGVTPSGGSRGRTSYEQLPAPLDLAFIAGDEFPFSLTFNRDLTGYTITAEVVDTATQTTAITSEEQTATLLPTKKYRWFLRWVDDGVTRTVLSGKAKASYP